MFSKQRDGLLPLDYVTVKHKLSLTDIYYVTHRLATGLKVLHGLDLKHGELKEINIFVLAENKVTLKY